ncbi:MAG TPA: hypothetical protein VFB41_11430 [Solirubrobacteraceae bacterium]|nr:hypothetical protein [Solirubrobacteraceae bacterium]
MPVATQYGITDLGRRALQRYDAQAGASERRTSPPERRATGNS